MLTMGPPGSSFPPNAKQGAVLSMSDALTLVGLLAELGAVKVIDQRNDETLAVAVVGLPDGRRLLAIERTYREGIGIITDPTEEELRVAREGDLWQLWNSDRRRLLHSIA